MYTFKSLLSVSVNEVRARGTGVMLFSVIIKDQNIIYFIGKVKPKCV